MNQNTMFLSPNAHAYAGILLFLLGSVMFCVLVYMVWNTLKPRKPNEEKLSTYECGEEAEGSGWYGFNVRFYKIALFFVLFEVEVVLLYPWAVSYSNAHLIALHGKGWVLFLLLELMVFMVLLFLGFAYLWLKKQLNWDLEQPRTNTIQSPVPASLYEQVNQKYSQS